MNERIEHITKQVDEHFDDLSIEFSREAWMEKFAELVVQECIDCLNPLSRNHSMVGAAQDTIKEHFGVEE